MKLIHKKNYLENKKKSSLEEMKRVFNYDKFTKEEAIGIIEYLVNKVEDKKYSIEKYHVDTESYFNDRIMVFQYTFLYLVEESKKEIARDEITTKYNVEIKNNHKIITNEAIMKKDDVSDSYVKLSFYNRYSDREVIFSDIDRPHILEIDIKDGRFKYINDFIESVLEARLANENYTISMEEMKILADSFAFRQKKQVKKLLLEYKEEKGD